MSDSYYRRKCTDLVHNLEPPKGRWQFFVNWLFDSLMPGMPVSTTGASSLKSPASIWRGVVFVVFIMGTMAIFVGNQAQAQVRGSERFAGTVTDEQGKPLSGATVAVNGVKTQTDSTGSFKVYAARADRYVINVTKSGYMMHPRFEYAPHVNLKLTLKKVTMHQISFDPSKSRKEIDPRKTQIDLPANALVDSEGKKPTGNVNLAMYTYDLENEPMPGDMGAIDSDGDPVYLESVGVFVAEFTDDSGKKYNLAEGKEATVSVLAPSTTIDASEISLWYYDETQGLWIEYENSTVIRVEGGRLEGKVDHFTAVNFDRKKSEPACVKVVIDESFFKFYGSLIQHTDKYQVEMKVMATTSGGFSPIVKTDFFSQAEEADGEKISEHVLYNLPPYSTVKFYIPPESETPYDSVSAGSPWGWKEGLDFIPDNYDDCKGKITLSIPKCAGSTCNVSTNGSNGTGNGSKAKPFATIQHGINTAKEGYTVLVHPGTYVENINFNGKNITVKSTDGAEKTIIDGNQNGSVVKFVNGENAQAVLKGFTLTNGNGNYMDIRGDLGYARQGGGIYTDKSNPTVTNLKIVRNKADFGAGIASYISGPMISNTVISDNIATTWGGGIYYSHSTYTDLEKNIVLKNTVVSKNKASGGAGITVNYGSQPILTNVTISENILVSDNPDRVKNDGNNGGAIWRGNKSGVIMSKSIIWNNSSTQIYWAGGDRWTSKISRSDIQGGESASLITWGDGNIDSDPLFVDARNGDYRLSMNSPAKKMGAHPVIVIYNAGIPTLSEWGVIIFILMLTTIGILFTMRRQAMVAAMSGGISDGTPPPVLVPAVFIKALTITGLLALIGFAISIGLSSSLPTTTDIVGTLISAPIFAYLIHLLMIFKRQ